MIQILFLDPVGLQQTIAAVLPAINDADHMLRIAENEEVKQNAEVSVKLAQIRDILSLD